MFQCVVFDFDGTLGDTLPVCVAGFRFALEELGGSRLADKEIMATFGPSEEGCAMRLLPDRAKEALAAYLKHYEARHDMCPDPFPGIRELLVFLRANGIKLALVTGKGPASCRISLERFGLLGFFEEVRTGHKEGPNKAEDIRSVLNAFGIPGSAAYCVGDHPGDATAARAAGAIPLAAAWASTADQEALRRACPDAVFKTVSELRSFFERRLREQTRR